MNCSHVQDALSAYHDGELPADQIAAVEQHLAGCESCAETLAGMRKLSDMASDLSSPGSPADMWSRIESDLDAEQSLARTHTQPHRRAILTVVSAAVLVIAAVAMWFRSHSEHGHDHMAVNFNRFLDQFPADPEVAQQTFLAAYEHETVPLQDAAEKLGYTPSATTTLPNGYKLKSVNVMKMPCCTCVQCVYTDGEKSLAVFEHDVEQPVWFGKRESVTCPCKGRETKIIPFNGQMAASWNNGKRHLTVIGAKDMEHVVDLVSHFGESATP